MVAQENTEEMIETAYDLQTGSYVRALESPEILQHRRDYGAAIASEISSLTSAGSILEPGVGEGTTLSFVAPALPVEPPHIHGFDISWSRIACCRKWLSENGTRQARLSVASILHTPYLENSFDVVYISHAIEPNGGREKQILAELYRVSSRYLILIEPGFELAGKEAQARMTKHGYCKNLVGHARDLGMNVIKHELFLPHTSLPLNPAAITVIAKNPDAPSAHPQLACPRYLTPLNEYSGAFYSPESLRAYPEILGIPCLRRKDGIIASTFEEVVALQK